MTSQDWTDIAHGLGRTFAYLGISVVMLAAGFHLLDMLTPGKLSEVIMVKRSRNAARVAAAAMISLALVIATAVFTTTKDFTFGLVSTAIFGLVGVVLQGLVYVVIDILTPGTLGDVVTDPEEHPGSWVLAASLLASGIIVAACIS